MRMFLTSLAAAGAAMIMVGGRAEAIPQWTTSDLIERSSIIGQFTVVEYDPYAYDYATETEQTRVVLQVNELIYGDWPSDEVEFMLPQGIAPDGTETAWTEVPTLEQGQTYLLFLREGEWHVNPIVGFERGAFRYLEQQGKNLLVNNEGRAVRNLNDYGFALDARVVERASHRDMGLLGTERRSTPLDASKAQEAIARAKSSDQLQTTLKVHVDKFRSTHEDRRESGVIFREPTPIRITGDDQ